MRRALLSALAGVLLTGCVVSKPPLLDATLEAALSADRPVPPTQVDWWTTLGDSTLNRLVAAALSQNFSVQAALVRLAEAKGQDAASVWSLLPSASLGRTSSTTGVRTYNTDGLTFSSPPSRRMGTTGTNLAVSWELPLFGKANAVFAQSEAQWRQQHWNLEAARLAVAAEVVQDYAEYRGVQQAVLTYEDDVKTLQQLSEAARTMKVEGVATQADVDQCAQRLVDTQTQLTSSRARLAQLEAKLDSLLGRTTGAAEVLKTSGVLTPPAVITIHANALRQRPDVRAAEENVALAAARAGAATASLWPQFTLGGELNLTAGNLDSTGSTRGLSNILTTHAGLQLPLLDWFARRADAKAKEAELLAVTLDYRQTVVNAWEETRGSLADYAAARDKQALNVQSVRLAESEVRRQQGILAAGVGTRQAELTAAVALHEKQRTLAQGHVAELQAWARLMKASFVAPELPKPVKTPTELSFNSQG